MKNIQSTKRHHFVPECYLKGFLDNGKLFALDIRQIQAGYNAYPRKRHPASICYLEDYYKIENGSLNDQFRLSGYHELFVETDVLTRLEGKYGDIVCNLLMSHELSYLDTMDLSDFIIQIKLRNLYWLENTIAKHKEEWINSSVEKIYEKHYSSNPRFAHIPEGIRRLVYDHVRDQNLYEPDFSKKMQLSSLIERYSGNAEGNRVVREAVINCKWMLLKAPDQGPYFITTDNPGFALDGSDQGLVYNTRFKDGFYFHFPLSPLYCLLITDDGSVTQREVKAISKVDLDPNGVIAINDYSIQVANKLIIGYDDWYLCQIAAINRPKNA